MGDNKKCPKCGGELVSCDMRYYKYCEKCNKYVKEE